MPTTPGSLSQLILDANRAGLSYQDMADRTVGTDARMHKQALQKLATAPPTHPPSVQALRALAHAIRQPLATVQRAAAEQWLEYQDTFQAGFDPELRAILDLLIDQPTAELRRWRMMIQAAQEAAQEAVRQNLEVGDEGQHRLGPGAEPASALS